MSKILSGENNPFFGKKHTNETKKKISEAIKNRKTNPNSKKVSVDGLVFDSASEAAKFFGLSSGTISYRCRKKTLNCFWV